MAIADIFSPIQLAILESVIDRIIPADEWPGARDAGVADYIANILTHDIPGNLPTYHAGIGSIEIEATRSFGASFSALSSEQQDAVLTNIEKGELKSDWIVDAREFFSLLVNHTAEGYYADPEQGGNRGAKSWDMVGFDMSRHAGK